MPENQVVTILPALEGEGQVTTTNAASIKKGQKLILPAESNLGSWLEVKQVLRYNKNTLKVRGKTQSGANAEVQLNPTDLVRRFN